MLVLSRTENSGLVFPDLGMEILVTGISSGRVLLAIDAPRSIHVLRSELVETSKRHEDSQRRSPATTAAAKPGLPKRQSEMARGLKGFVVHRCSELSAGLKAAPQPAAEETSTSKDLAARIKRIQNKLDVAKHEISEGRYLTAESLVDEMDGSMVSEPHNEYCLN